MSKPFLSVVVPNYNHGHYLRGCLAAIFNQSRPPDEVLVFDDASTDGSVEVLREIAAREPRLRVIVHQSNQGVVRTVNEGIREARGTHIVLRAADDLDFPGHFEAALAMFEAHPRAGICYSHPATFGHDTMDFQPNSPFWSDESRFFSPAEFVEVIAGSAIWGHSAILRRETMLEIGGYVPEHEWHSDWFANLVVAFRHGVCYIPKTLCAMRLAPSTYMRNFDNWERQQGVVDALLRSIVSPEYRDVLPFFIRGSAFSQLGESVLRGVMANPEHWTAEIQLLTQQLAMQRAQWTTSMIENRARQAAMMDTAERHSALLAVANTALIAGDRASAVSASRRILREDPRHAGAIRVFAELVVTEAKAKRGSEWWEQETARLISDARWPEALPEPSEADVLRGEEAFQNGQMDRAGAFFARVLRERSGEVQAWNNLGVVLGAVGRPEDGLRAIEQALALSPLDEDGRYNWAQLALGLGRHDSAAWVASDLCNARPNQREYIELAAAANRPLR